MFQNNVVSAVSTNPIFDAFICFSCILPSPFALQFEKAGDFFESLERLERALDAYAKGRSYRRAVDLARRAFPAQVLPVVMGGGWTGGRIWK
jgi:hypothetical protein